MTKRTCVFDMLAVLLAVTACGRAKAGPASKAPARGRRTFNSEVAFNVYVRKTPDDDAELIGRTPSDKPLKIPAGVSWWVKPIRPTNMAKVRAAIRVAKIPGLRLRVASDADLAHLKGLTGLRTLNLWNCEEITNDGTAYLSGLKELRTLYVGGTQITDAGLAPLKGLTKLWTLNLDETQITDAGLAHLKGLANLRTLNLDETQITDAGLAAHLKGVTKLRTLDLWGCEQITDEGVADLKKALPNTTIVWR